MGARVRKTCSGRPLATISRVQLRALEQLGVVAVGEHPPAVEHDDLLGEGDGREAVGDDEGRAPGHRLVEREPDQALGGRVDRGGGIVEDQHARVGQQRAGNGQALTLAA